MWELVEHGTGRKQLRPIFGLGLGPNLPALLISHITINSSREWMLEPMKTVTVFFLLFGIQSPSKASQSSNVSLNFIPTQNNWELIRSQPFILRTIGYGVGRSHDSFLQKNPFACSLHKIPDSSSPRLESCYWGYNGQTIPETAENSLMFAKNEVDKTVSLMPNSENNLRITEQTFSVKWTFITVMWAGLVSELPGDKWDSNWSGTSLVHAVWDLNQLTTWKWHVTYEKK